MTTIFIIFLVAFGIAMLMTALLIPLSRKHNFTDQPDDIRKLQSVAIPKTGGLSIFAGFTIPLLLLLYFEDRTLVSNLVIHFSEGLLNLIYLSLAVIIIGIIDDILDLRARWKLIGQIAIGYAAYYIGLRIDIINIPFAGAVDLGNLAPLLTVFWFVACMNSVNLLDGMDGLAGGACLFATISILSMSLIYGNAAGILLMACLAGSTAGFLVFNFPPAKIYLGNSGSMLLGFLIAALSLIGAHHKAETAVALLIPIVALGLPIIDTTLAILRRWYHRVPISGADREHIHHIITSMGYSPRTAVLILYGICLAFGLLSLLLLIPRSEIAVLVIIFLGMIIYASARIFTGMTFGKVITRLGEDSLRNQKKRLIKLAGQRAMTGIKNAITPDAGWKHFCLLLEVIGFDHARLTLNLSGKADPIMLEWNNPESAQRTTPSENFVDHSVTTLAILWEGCPVGRIELHSHASMVSDIWLPESAEMLNQTRTALESRIIQIYTCS